MGFKKYSASERKEYYRKQLNSKNKNQRDFATGYLAQCYDLESDSLDGNWCYWQGIKAAARMQQKLDEIKF